MAEKKDVPSDYQSHPMHREYDVFRSLVKDSTIPHKSAAAGEKDSEALFELADSNVESAPAIDIHGMLLHYFVLFSFVASSSIRVDTTKTVEGRPARITVQYVSMQRVREILVTTVRNFVLPLPI